MSNDSPDIDRLEQEINEHFRDAFVSLLEAQHHIRDARISSASLVDTGNLPEDFLDELESTITNLVLQHGIIKIGKHRPEVHNDNED